MDLPVILICYKRPHHTSQVLRALEKQNVSNLIIFSDGPKSEQDVPLVSQTRNLIKSISWTTPEIIEQQENKGLAQSIVAAVDYVLSCHDHMVLLEDDCVPSPHFFDFIRSGLSRYKDDENVFGINGYTLPISHKLLRQYPYDAYFHPRIGSWGWATWKRAWQHYDSDLGKLYDLAVKKNVDLAQGGFDIIENLILKMGVQNLDIWTLNWVLSVYLQGGCYLYPTRSQIQNIGFDGSGTNCGKSTAFVSFQTDLAVSRLPDSFFYESSLVSSINDKMNAVVKPKFPQLRSLFKGRLFNCNRSVQKKLRIVHINTHDIAGGAAKVAWRLAEAQRKQGHRVNLLVGQRLSDKRFSQQIKFEIPPALQHGCDEQGLLYYQFRGAPNLVQHPLVRDADVIHLHNLHGNYFNPYFLIPLSREKPVIWTLHDMQAITGHCAYSLECEGWRFGCEDCPNLTTYPAINHDTSTRLLKDKHYIYNQSRLSIVAPSQWLFDKLAVSVLQKQSQRLVYNGVNTEMFQPMERNKLRQNMAIDDETVVLGIVAHGGISNNFKGGSSVLAVFDRFTKNNRKCVLLNIGDERPSLHPAIINIPRVSNEVELCQLYNVMDIFLLPSEADNCPLVVLESLACGTPVAAFATGGIPELVRDGIDGVIVERGQLEQLFDRIGEMIDGPEVTRMFRANARARAMDFKHEKIVEQYESIYREAIVSL